MTYIGKLSFMQKRPGLSYRFHLAFTICICLSTLIIGCRKGGIINESMKLLQMLDTSSGQEFSDNLDKLKMHDYVTPANINAEKGKEFMVRYKMDNIFGIYADKWIIEQK